MSKLRQYSDQTSTEIGGNVDEVMQQAKYLDEKVVWVHQNSPI